MNKINASLIVSSVTILVLAFLAYIPLNVFAATVCNGNSCYYVVCNTNSDCGTNKFNQWAYSCQNNNLYQEYITHTCNNPGTTQATCTSSKQPQLIQTCNSNQQCQSGLWYTGCASVTNNTNTNNNNTNTTYQLYSYQKCVGNSVYWFDSNGKQQTLYQTCGGNQTCSSSSNSCVNLSAPTPPPSSPLICRSNTIKGCINNSVYWYDSCGNQEGVYQNCSNTNQVCQDGACVAGQSYYQPQIPIKRPTPTPSSQNISTTKNKDLAIAIFGKKESDPLQWEKNVNAINNDKIAFLLTIKNTTASPIDKVLVKVNVTKGVDYNNDLKIDNVSSEEDIELGVNLGTIPQNTSRSVSFTGVIKAADLGSDKPENEIKIIGTTSTGTRTDSDSFTIKVSTPTPTPTPSPTQVENKDNNKATESSPLTNLLKKWYFWVGIAIILIFLFIVIFKKLSSKV